MLTEIEVHKIAVWATGKDTGMSSQNLARAAMGLPVEPHTYPHDGGDLGRCLRLIEFCPAVFGGVEALASVSGPWKRLHERWDELRALHDQGTPAANKELYALMQRLINPRNLRAYSWTKDENGFWDMNADFDAGTAKTVVFGAGSIRMGDTP